MRKYSNLKLLQWINKLYPLFDSYMNPFKAKHHYCMDRVRSAGSTFSAVDVSYYTDNTSLHCYSIDFNSSLHVWLTSTERVQTVAAKYAGMLFPS